MVSKQEEANMATSVQNIKNIGFLANSWIFMPRQRFVSTFPTYMNEFRGPWAITLVFLSKGCQLNWIHFWLERGVVNRLWFGHWSSYHPAALCECSQEVLLWRSGHVSAANWPLWPVEASKVGGMSGWKYMFWAKMTCLLALQGVELVAVFGWKNCILVEV